MVRSLNEFQPAILMGYASAMTLLAREQSAGRLKLDVVLVEPGGECLTPAARSQIEAAFSCLVREGYGASEFASIASDCGHGWLHVNADWVILEPVDEGYQPVPPGQPSRKVLLTNLANRVQPIIRYDLGDSIVVRPDPCPCGIRLPAIRVKGRSAQVLCFQKPNGEPVPLLSLAVETVVEDTPGVRRFQVIQTSPVKLRVRFEAEPDASPQQVGERAAQRLRDYLSVQGLPSVIVEQAPEPPRIDPRTGKFRLVWVDLSE
jgi:phenylacetate-coenzyme A ligase PaaK-like adenylate-forming protein